ncbi:MAG: hypothetical protein WBQ73_02840 [Candidatus Babeliales bacterium]
MFEVRENNRDYTQLTVSYELIILLQWLIKYESRKLKKMVASSYKKGLSEALDSIYTTIATKPEWPQELHDTFVTFFSLLENIVKEVTTESTLDTFLDKKLLSTLDQIDPKICDMQTIKYSLELVAEKLKNRPDSNTQQLLLSEILRQWAPPGTIKKKTMN